MHRFVLGCIPNDLSHDSCLCCQSVLLSRLEVKFCFQHFLSECLLTPVFTAQWSAFFEATELAQVNLNQVGKSILNGILTQVCY